jgi:predicted Rossmann fold nucleotide-binding protein DprA/Smf involved in DNA uptake
MRNRIISGWDSALLVVETRINGGALISAAQAADHGRNLYEGLFDRNGGSVSGWLSFGF